MFGLLLRSFFLCGIIYFYSTGVWKFIDDYFRHEYKKYLTEEFKRNKHLQQNPDIPIQLPPSLHSEELAGVKSIIGSHEVMKTCEGDVGRLNVASDYHNQQTTSDRQSRDDDGFINYWLEPRTKDNSDHNLYCQPKEATCEDN